MKKYIIILLAFFPLFGFGQIQTKYAADRFAVNQQITASTAYQIEVAGGNYFWDLTAFWGTTSKLTTSYVKVQESKDGVKWVNCDMDSLTLATTPGLVADFQGDQILSKYIRLYFKVTSGDTVKGLNIDFVFKQR